MRIKDAPSKNMISLILVKLYKYSVTKQKLDLPYSMAADMSQNTR